MSFWVILVVLVFLVRRRRTKVEFHTKVEL